MSFLSAIIIPKVIAEIESQITAHFPDIEEVVWKEMQILATNFIAAVENKINKPSNPQV